MFSNSPPLDVRAIISRTILILLSIIATALPLTVSAADFPSVKPIRIVVPYPPGGTADILTRDLGQRLAHELGQSVVIDNRAGAGTAIGARHVADAPPDGYTLLMGTVTSHAINPSLRPQIGYDPVKDFTALAAIGEVPYAIVTHPSRNIPTLQALIKASSKAPHPLSYSSAGVGSANHLSGVLLKDITGEEFLHVPYQGSAPALNDLLAGQVDFMFDLVTTSQAHVQGGKLVALATTGRERAAGLPQVPTTTELGFPKLVVTSWFGLFAPAGLPQDVQVKLDAALNKVLSQPDTQEKLKGYGLALMDQRGTEFGKLVQQDYEHWTTIAKSADLKLEN